MKRFIALILSLLMLFSLVACSSSLNEITTAEETKTENKDRVETKTEEKDLGPITYPSSFSVGFGRQEMNPEDKVTLTMGGISEGVKEDLFATCVAICDGENVALLFHMDMKETPDVIFSACTKQIRDRFGIPAENIIMTATHTHASPHTTLSDAGNIRWRTKLTKSVITATEQALRDLAPAEIFVGTGDTAGIAFSRRLKLADGSYKMNPKAEDNPVAPEVEADPELRTIRFEREGKKDIVLANWQSHYGAGGNHITSDFVHYMRKGVEEEGERLFAYFNGASANLSLHNYLGPQTYSDYIASGKALATIALEALENEEKAESGRIVAKHTDMIGKVKQDTEERKQQAKEIAATSGVDQEVLIQKYGFDSIHDVNSTNTRARMEEETPIPITVITFGEIAFASNPFELFDISGREIREGSPYKMTFNCSYSNGHLGYMPPDEIFPHGSYEVVKAFFIPGTAENVVAESLRLLNECKSAN